jgi:hypothetical protein
MKIKIKEIRKDYYNIIFKTSDNEIIKVFEKSEIRQIIQDLDDAI